MFGFIYKNSVVTKLFLAFLGFVFIVGTAVMFGPGSWNFGVGNFVIKVGDVKITPKEFRLQLVRLQKDYPKASETQLKELALRILVGEAVLAYLAERDGFFVSDAEVKERIRKMFSVNGTFSPHALERYLEATRLTPKEFEEIIKRQILADKYRKAVYRTSYADDAVSEVNLLPLTTTLKVRVYELTPGALNLKPTLSEEKLKEFYQLTASRWVSVEPERVKVYEVEGTQKVKELYAALSEGREVPVKPSAVILSEELPKVEGKLKKVVERAFESKKPQVEKLDGERYAVAVYEPERRKELSFEEVKKLKAFVEAAENYYAAEEIRKNLSTYLEKLKKGELEVKPESAQLSAFELMKKYSLGFQELFSILRGENELVIPTPRGGIVIFVESASNSPLSPEVADGVRLQVRYGDYVKKLRALVNYYIESGKVEVGINPNFAPKGQR